MLQNSQRKIAERERERVLGFKKIFAKFGKNRAKNSEKLAKLSNQKSGEKFGNFAKILNFAESLNKKSGKSSNKKFQISRKFKFAGGILAVFSLIFCAFAILQNRNFANAFSFGDGGLALLANTNVSTNVEYSYLNAGEKLYVKTTYNPNDQLRAAAKNLTTFVYAPDGSLAGSCAIADGVWFTDNGKYCEINITAKTAGIYKTYSINDISAGMNYEIKVSDAGGKEIKGRTWSNSVSLLQGADVSCYDSASDVAADIHEDCKRKVGTDWTQARDLTFYAVNDAGNIYEVNLYDYQGYSSTISLDAAGNAVENASCASAYESQGSLVGDPKFFAKRADCAKYRLFFEAPNADLPKEANSADGPLQILPVSKPNGNSTNLENLVPTLDTATIVQDMNFTESQTSANKSGVLAFKFAPAFSGNYKILIDIDSDGTIDREDDFYAPGGAANENVEYNFDGKDANGKDISPNRVIKFQVKFDKLAETHLVVRDAEAMGGLSLKKVNGAAKGDATVYWDDRNLAGCAAGTTLTNDVCYGTTTEPYNLTPQMDGTAGVNSAVAGGVHGWQQYFEVRDNVFVGNGWGDNRALDTWVYLPTDTASNAFANAPAMYVVKFATNGGAAVAQQKVLPNSSASSATTAKDGYDFSGWYKNSNLTGAEFDFATKITADTTLYAAYDAHEYSVIYDKNAANAQGNMSDTRAVFASDVQTSANAFSRLGYTFKNWNSKPDGSGTNFANNYEFSPYNVAKNTTLYAIWQINSYEISFDNNCENDSDISDNANNSAQNSANSCSENPENQSVDYGNLAQNPAKNADEIPTRDGYDFKYFYVCADKMQAEFDFATKITENVKLCAKWEIQTFKVDFVDKTGENLAEIPAQNVNFGNSAQNPAENDEIPARDGEIFVGWFADENYKNSYDFSAKIIENTKIYAKFEKVCPWNPRISEKNENCQKPAENEKESSQIPTAPNTGIFQNNFVDFASIFAKLFREM